MGARLAAVAVLALMTVGPARAEGARYLIVCPEHFEDAVQPLADWKTRKGMLAEVVTTAETGWSSYEVFMYIADAVADWDPAPEYVLFVGDSSQIQYFGSSDVAYGSIDGDTFIEIHPGRLPATSTEEVDLMIQKILAYEREPTLDETYFRSAAFMVARDHDDDDWAHYFNDAEWAAGLMGQWGMDNTEVISSSTHPNAGADFRDMADAGIAYATYHGQSAGWGTYNQPSSLDNGPTLPIILGYTCGGGSHGPSWLSTGTAADPRGAAGYVGQMTSCSGCAHWRSSLRRGFWGYLFEDTAPTEIVTFGAAAEAARLQYYNEHLATTEYSSSQLWGDPELNLWTGIPDSITVSHPEIAPRGEFEMTVTVSAAGAARAGAVVCIMSDEDTYEVVETGEDGCAPFSLDTTEDDELYITVTGRNLRPYEGTLSIAGSAPAGDDDDDDDFGDDDVWADDDDDSEDVITTDPIGTETDVGMGDCSCSQTARSHGAIAALMLGVVAFARRRV